MIIPKQLRGDYENGNKLGQTFIIDGVGHDLYPRSWQRIENMADFNDDFTYGLGDAIILYSRNEEDKNRFAAMQERLKSKLLMGLTLIR